jgi:hypothetical protein
MNEIVQDKATAMVQRRANDRALDVLSALPRDVRIALADDIAACEPGTRRFYRSAVDLGVRLTPIQQREVACCPLGLAVYHLTRLHPDVLNLPLEDWYEDYACTTGFHYARLLSHGPHKGPLTDEQARLKAAFTAFIALWDEHRIPSAALIVRLRQNDDLDDANHGPSDGSPGPLSAGGSNQ